MRTLVAANTLRALALTWLCFCTAAIAEARNVEYLSFATEDETNTMEIFQKASPAVV